MAKTFLTSIDLSLNELLNARIHNVATLPAVGSSRPGQKVFNTTDGQEYFFDGTVWQNTKTNIALSGDAAGSTLPSVVIADGKIGTSKLVDKSVTGGLSGKIALATITPDNVHADYKDGAVGNPSLRTLGTGSQQAAAGNDTRLSDTRTPTAGSVRDSAVASDAAIARTKIANPTADVSNGGYRLTNLASGTQDTDAATVAQVNAVRQGLDRKNSVAAATTANLAVTATNTTLTASANGVLVIDTVTLPLGERVLIKNQTDATQNGIYDITSVGSASTPWVLTRSNDANATGKITVGSETLVDSPASTANGQQSWAVVTMGSASWAPGTVTSNWTQIAGVSDVTAGNGLTRAAGNILNVGAGTGVLVTADQIAIDTSLVTRKFPGQLAGGATSEVITHNLGSRAVDVVLYNLAAPYDEVVADVERTTVNTVTIRSNVAIPANSIGYIVVG